MRSGWFYDCECRRVYDYVRELIGTGIPDTMLRAEEKFIHGFDKIKFVTGAVTGSGTTRYLGMVLRQAVQEGKRAAYFWPEDLIAKDDDEDGAIKLERIESAEVLCLNRLGSGAKWLQDRALDFIQRRIDNGVVIFVGVEDSTAWPPLKNVRVLTVEENGPLPEFDWKKLRSEAESYSKRVTGYGEKIGRS